VSTDSNHSSGQEILVTKFAVSLELPPDGEIDLDAVSPYLQSLTSRGLSRTGNVFRVELPGPTEAAHYLLLVTVDIPAPLGINENFLALLPEGSKMSVVNRYESVNLWPEPETGAQS
jgi:hypothetical protein